MLSGLGDESMHHGSGTTHGRRPDSTEPTRCVLRGVLLHYSMRCMLRYKVQVVKVSTDVRATSDLVTTVKPYESTMPYCTSVRLRSPCRVRCSACSLHAWLIVCRSRKRDPICAYRVQYMYKLYILGSGGGPVHWCVRVTVYIDQCRVISDMMSTRVPLWNLWVTRYTSIRST